MQILPINIQNSDSTIAARSAVVKSNYIHKMRSICLRGFVLDIQNKSIDQIEQIIGNAWLNSFNGIINKLANKAQLINQPFIASLVTITRQLTKQNDFIFKIDYTISIVNRDPEFLGIPDPTYNHFESAFDSSNYFDFKFSNCITNDIQRFYINVKSDDKNINGMISNSLTYTWNKLNAQTPQDSGAISFRYLTTGGYYDSIQQEITRVNLAWLVYQTNPSALYFNLPTINNIIDSFSMNNVIVTSVIPYKLFKVYLNNYTSSYSNSLNEFLTKSWTLANPNYVTSSFLIAKLDQYKMLSNSLTSKSATTTSRYKKLKKKKILLNF